jgi:NADH-quinone oxidoreductase subunit L
MLSLLWVIPAAPLAGFLVLALFGARMPSRAVAAVGTGSIAVSAVAALLAGGSFLAEPPPESAFVQRLWTLMNIPGLTIDVSLYLDALSLVMVAVVTVVGFLIHLYSTEFMAGEEGYSRFFAYMNLFVASMVVLVLAGDLIVLYIGWEGVGLCSYLLIGFWYRDPANGAAARKAFIVTRVGDAAMAVGLFLLVYALGTLEIQELMARARAQWPVGAVPAVAAAALLLGGAVGKSAQLPLQTWLPDAMAGPTPVSALIHAATMVTAGVYLIARTNVLFLLAPPVMTAVAVIGAATLLLSGASALAQRDIKRVLAYSTISQIGYMFLALGTGAWSAAIFHFMTHAFFKALLFLGAGAVILSFHHEHDIFRMGGLRRQLPITFWTFLIASASLAGFPVLTAGFFSKDMILLQAWASGPSGPWLWGAGVLGVFLTALYAFRLVFRVFFGTPGGTAGGEPGLRMTVPLLVLAVLSAVGGYLEVHLPVGGIHAFSDFLETALPSSDGVPAPERVGAALLAASVTATLLGILLAWALFLKKPHLANDLARTPDGAAGHRFLLAGWGFDRLYDVLFVRPFVRLAQADRHDVVDSVYTGIARAGAVVHHLLSVSITGRIRWYAAGIAAGAVFAVAAVVLL